LSFSSAHPALRRALAARSYAEPTPVQAQVLEAEADRDLLVSAQTGSGKTVAFGLALAPRLLGDSERFEKAGPPRALVIAPTRELAIQVHRELTWLYAETGARMTTCVGGMDPRTERYALGAGVHFVIGTPGRLCDHLERGALVLSRIEAVVLDEADEMLDMGFREDLERLLDAMPAERRTLMFTATIPGGIATMAKRYQKKALRVAATGEGDRHRDIEYQAIPVFPRERDLAVVNLLRYHDAPGALVFCATRDGVTHLAANLSERGFSVAALSGELSQRERNTALQALRDGRARVCVATDVAARGLDLPDLGLVIHADLPQNGSVLVHRSGRTGRAGKHGIAIILAPDRTRRFVERMLQTAKIDAPWREAPSAEDIRVRDQDQLVLEIRALADDVTEEDRKVASLLLADKPAEALVAALVRQRRDARPLPEELTRVMGPAKPAPRAAAKPPRNERRIANQGNPNGPDRRRVNKGGDLQKAARAIEREERTTRGPERTERDERPARAPDRDERPARGPERPARGSERPARGPDRDERPARGAAASPNVTGGGRWFTVNVGRSKNADPKWLIPLLCRRGNVTKKAIGKIQVLMRETRVEIAPDVAADFAEAIRRPDDKDKNIHIEPVDE
jgi:ATP-dependent RNA helicase DeaD